MECAPGTLKSDSLDTCIQCKTVQYSAFSFSASLMHCFPLFCAVLTFSALSRVGLDFRSLDKGQDVVSTSTSTLVLFGLFGRATHSNNDWSKVGFNIQHSLGHYQTSSCGQHQTHSYHSHHYHCHHHDHHPEAKQA